jgi:hypothetical protein
MVLQVMMAQYLLYVLVDQAGQEPGESHIKISISLFLLRWSNLHEELASAYEVSNKNIVATVIKTPTVTTITIINFMKINRKIVFCRFCKLCYRYLQEEMKMAEGNLGIKIYGRYF